MLSNKAKYGLKALIYLAENADGPASLISDIAEKNQLPKKFLDAILLELRKHGILNSKKGPGGGYSLARPANTIMVGQVIRILDGPIAPIACASRGSFKPCEDCTDVRNCAIRAVMLDVRDAMADILDQTSIADMQRKSDDREFVLMYDI
ncbi:MAG: Rrf2 family transcriptional regulator [Azospirillaceae bacterium]|nr:Rrf2 family transcriptional regulator [Azospirillaceae bacterium]